MGGVQQWSSDRQVTPLVSSLASLGTQHNAISPLFASYYQDHGAMISLGDPLTSAFPIAQGWVQFFVGGALFLPVARSASVSHSTNTLLSELVDASTKNIVVGVVRLNLLQALLTTGSLAAVGGEGSTLTYVNLRVATLSSSMVASSTAHQLAAINTYIRATDNQTMFVQSGMRAGEDVGHVIAQPFWSYINRSDVAPDGWQEDIGVPLTEALPFTVAQNGSIHHMLVQIFSYGGLLFDQDSSVDQPVISRLNTGLDYLHTFGLPDVQVSAGQQLWFAGRKCAA